jgi:hypothetical protein
MSPVGGRSGPSIRIGSIRLSCTPALAQAIQQQAVKKRRLQLGLSYRMISAHLPLNPLIGLLKAISQRG